MIGAFPRIYSSCVTDPTLSRSASVSLLKLKSRVSLDTTASILYSRTICEDEASALPIGIRRHHFGGLHLSLGPASSCMQLPDVEHRCSPS